MTNDPKKITVGDIIRAISEPVNPVFCVDEKDAHNKECGKAGQCVTRQVWIEVGEKITEYFDSITISDLCERAREMGIMKDVKHPFDYCI